MKWMRERDSLIAQTMAFVQTVAGRKEDAAPRAGPEPAKLEPAKSEPEKPEPEKPEIDVAAFNAVRNALDIAPPPREALRSVLYNAPPNTLQPARPIVPSELQNEIRSRIASFRAHQERFNRERAEYFNATLARLRASLDEVAAGRSEK